MRQKSRSVLLALDALINIVLGAVLLSAPVGTIAWLGLPATDTPFYVSVLGAILLGIGLALWIEWRNSKQRGLGLGGAIVINLLGAGTVFVWLLIDPFTMPPRGYALLWIVVSAVAVTAFAEIRAVTRPGRD